MGNDPPGLATQALTDQYGHSPRSFSKFLLEIEHALPTWYWFYWDVD